MAAARGVVVERVSLADSPEGVAQRATLPATLAALGGNVLFIGSAMGDSQLCRLELRGGGGGGEGGGLQEGGREEEDGAASCLPPPLLHELQRFPSLGPIVDFDLIDSTRQQQQQQGGAGSGGGGGGGQLVAACGGYSEGSLRIVRAGIGLREAACVDLPGINGLWALRREGRSPHAAFLLQSYATESRLFGIEVGG